MPVDLLVHDLHDDGLVRAVTDALDTLVADDVVARIVDRDHTVWDDDPDEIANRLGWLDAPSTYAEQVDELVALRDACREAGLTHVLVLGMGGSSLFPEVVSRVYRDRQGEAGTGLELGIVDSTDPAALLRAAETFPEDTTLYVPASKSGSTIETRSQLEWFWGRRHEARGDEAGSQFVGITDPGSQLEELGAERGFRAVLTNDPDIGGRFSALSLFGVAPAALAGVDVAALLAAGQRGVERTREPHPSDNPALHLGAALGALALEGRDKLTLVLPDVLAPLGVWVEQLVAESTGKQGVGIVPVVDEPVGPPEVYGDDRVFVVVGDVPESVAALGEAGQPVLRLGSSDGAVHRDDLGELLVLFEYATAIAGRVLGINPFDQPNVEAAKKAAGRVLDEGATDVATTTCKDLLTEVGDGDVLVLTAFVDPEGDTAAALPGVAETLRDEHGVPVTVGIGPRYLHSTGQLHKGYAQRCVVVQVVGDDPDDTAPPVPVNGREFTFSELKHAQADGDLQALAEAGTRAGRVTVPDLEAQGGD